MGILDRDYMKRPRPGLKPGKFDLDRAGVRFRIWLEEVPLATWSLSVLVLFVSGGWYLLGKNLFLPPPDNLNEAIAMMHLRSVCTEVRDWMAVNFILDGDLIRNRRILPVVGHILIHGGVMNGILGLGGVLVFGLCLEKDGWGSGKVAVLMCAAVLSSIALVALRGQSTSVYGCWAISSALAAAVAFQESSLVAAGKSIRMAAVLYLMACLLGLPRLLSGEPTQYLLLSSGIGIGSGFGVWSRRRQWLL